MKPGLQLQIGQQLTMTPQLQQAIRLLQLSTLELQVEIQDILESNPLLEPVDSDDGLSSSTDSSAELAPIDYREAENLIATQDEIQPVDMNQPDTLPNELPVDAVWEDVFANGSASSGLTRHDDDNALDSQNAAPETLNAHLAWQLNLTPFTATDREIATAILDGIDERGYLTSSLEDILLAVTPADNPDAIELDEVEAVLHRIQQFDPPGVAARDLSECLLIQLRQLPDNTAHLATAKLLTQKHLPLLGNRDFGNLMRLLKVSESDMKAAIALIRRLNPTPGGLINLSHETEYIIPDVIVRRRNNRWSVELNPENTPHLRINPGYAAMLQRGSSSADNSYLRTHLQEANWFLRSLQSRNDTLLKVAACIVEHQRAFLETGPEAMKPLVLREIAEEVGMHESSISRVTSQKYMHTPRGIFELKYFFSSHVGMSDGGEASSIAIRAMIKKLIASENTRKPLSDSKLVDLLQQQGIDVARRTVAKYRELLNIPPSNERKSLS